MENPPSGNPGPGRMAESIALHRYSEPVQPDEECIIPGPYAPRHIDQVLFAGAIASTAYAESGGRSAPDRIDAP